MTTELYLFHILNNITWSGTEQHAVEEEVLGK